MALLHRLLAETLADLDWFRERGGSPRQLAILERRAADYRRALADLR